MCAHHKQDSPLPALAQECSTNDAFKHFQAECRKASDAAARVSGQKPVRGQSLGPSWSPNCRVPFSHDPVSVLRFLDAASYMKDLRTADIAFAKGVKALFPERHQELMAQAQKVPSRCVLLRARCRISDSRVADPFRILKKLVCAHGIHKTKLEAQMCQR